MNNIPKVIHYFWFGNNPKPEIVTKCIASWKKYMPDWEIKEWNENNYDVHCGDTFRNRLTTLRDASQSRFYLHSWYS